MSPSNGKTYGIQPARNTAVDYLLAGANKIVTLSSNEGCETKLVTPKGVPSMWTSPLRRAGGVSLMTWTAVPSLSATTGPAD